MEVSPIKTISPNNKELSSKSSPGRKVFLPGFLHVVILCFALAGCTISSEEIEFKRATEAVQKSDNESALKHFKFIVDRYEKTPIALKAAKEAARITHYELKNHGEAIRFYKHIVLNAPDQVDRIEAQQKIADIHFNQTLDYAQAITEYSRLLDLPHAEVDDISYRMAITRSYFYLNNFFQAQIEIDNLIKKIKDPAILFEALFLKANILLTKKSLDDAAAVLRLILEKYPERSKTEQIGLVLAVTYEEQQNYAKAIEVLESIKNVYPRKAFIEGKIKTLKERQSLLPGARGFRK